MTKHHDEKQQQRKVEQEAGYENIIYWKRAHHDWKFWFVTFVMLLAITTYVITNNHVGRNPMPTPPNLIAK